MGFTARQRTMIETNLARDRAETLLRELLDASRAVQIHNIVKSQTPMDCVDSLDTAVSSARRLVNILNDSLWLAEHDLDDDDLLILDELGWPEHEDLHEILTLEEDLQAEDLGHQSLAKQPTSTITS